MDRIKEKITYYRTLITLFWTGLFLTSSGIGWLVKNPFPLKGFPLIIFFTAVFVLIISLTFFDRRIRKLIKEL